MSNPKPPFVERRRDRRTENRASLGMDETVGKAQMLTDAERVYAWRKGLDELLDEYVQACKSIDRQESFLWPMPARKQQVARCLTAIYTHIEIRPLGLCLP